MFRAIIDEPSLLVKSLSVVSNLVLEGTFQIKKDSINLVAMDRANISMVIYKLLSSAFSQWEIDSEKLITLNIEKLVQVLKRATSRDKIMLELDEENNKLNVIMKGISTRTFSIPLLEDGELRDTPSNINYDSKIEVDSEVLKQGIEDASLVSDAVLFIADNEVFTMKAEGDVSKASLTLSKESPALHAIQVREAMKAKYSVDYLTKIIKSAGLSDKVAVYFKTDYPLRLDFTITDKLNMSFILAPRIETD